MFFSHLWKTLPSRDRETLLNDLNNRLDDEGRLHLRLDKEQCFLGALRLKDPDPVKIDAGFASYESKIEVAGSTVRYSRELVWRDVLINPERTEELRRFEGAIGADEFAAVVLKHQ